MDYDRNAGVNPWISRFKSIRSIFITDVSNGATQRLTERSEDATAPTYHACIFSPDDSKIAYMRPNPRTDDEQCQLFTVDIPIR